MLINNKIYKISHIDCILSHLNNGETDIILSHLAPAYVKNKRFTKSMSTFRIQQLELCHREMFGNMVVTCANPKVNFTEPSTKLLETGKLDMMAPNTGRNNVIVRRSILSCCDEIRHPDYEKRRASELMDELLVEIYNNMHNGTTDYYSTSGKSQRSVWMEVVDVHEKGVTELYTIIQCLRGYIARTGSVLVRQLKRRDALRRQQQAHCDVITRALIQRASESVDMRFTIQPIPGESGFSQWVAAMKMVAQLPGGIPPEFRRRLWLTMAERHLASRGVDWLQVEKSCFNEWSHPADAELGIQIVKDLHRTGCSLFCGEDGQENQALLKKVLLAYARWNKAVGYCQGFNMLAALILQVTDRCESDALKLMIYLIEGVLPDSYFADSLRGLSVDMAVFRELLRSKLPKLSKHLDLLQNAGRGKDGSRSYEPPLTNVFTMQWFLTLFCNCLPQPTVLRVWDLIFLEGNEILLRSALAIWQVLAPRILVTRTADEFYCIMGALTRELLEFNLIDANSLIKAIVSIGPLNELKNLRDHYLYNITPWGTSIPNSETKQINLHPKHSIPLDISALKKQYVKLKQRQRQAHIIFSAAISRQPPPATPIAMNHLLLGKSALVPSKRLGPPKGSIPPVRQVPTSTLQWKDTLKPTSSSSSSDTELCDDDVHSSTDDEEDLSKSQFKDNLNSGDTSLIKVDNTVNVSEDSANTETTQNLPAASLNFPDVNQPPSSLSTSPVNLKVTSDSEDEGSDFEIFLADRIKCFKKTNSSNESSEVNVRLTRRNSERALQIIQENSLILHRIMQCQSRLSPSPPLLFNNATETMDPRSDVTDNSLCPVSYLLDENIEPTNERSKLTEINTIQDWLTTSEETEIENIEESPLNIDIESGTKSPDYGSRYHSILEKSKSLDERYNSLISNSNKKSKPSFLGRLHESKSETPVGSKVYGINESPSHNFTDNSVLDAILTKMESQEPVVASSFSDDNIKDTKSNKLIQENLDLLKSFSINKLKDKEDTSTKKSNRSRKLIQENVNLLESISSEKSLAGSFCDLPGHSMESFDTFLPKKGISDQDLKEDCPTECFFSTDTNNDIATNEKEDEKDYSCKFNNCSTTQEGRKSFETFKKAADQNSIKENHTEFKQSELEEKDSAISINFTSSSQDLSENLVNSEDLELRLPIFDSFDSNIKRSYSLSPSEFKSKNDKDFSCDKNIKTPEIPSSPVLNLNLVSYNSPSTDTFSKKSSPSDITSNTSPDVSKCIFLENPTKAPTFNDIFTGNKSPSHTFNPFPVTLSSRQSKELPLKLGIYKK